MKKLIILVGVIAFLSACNNTNSTDTKDTDDAIVNNNFIALKDIQSKGIDYIDQEIQTQGIADHVCKHGGKKVLLVGDGVDIHVLSEERFDESIVGKEIIVTGIMKEDRTDEASLLQLEEDAINSHSKGEDAEVRQERIITYVNMMRDSLKSSGVDHFSEFHIDYISHKVVE